MSQVEAPLHSVGKAFDALRSVVAEWRAQGKRTTTAGVKPALVRATDGQFNERDLGFASFRAFLVAAEEAEVIRLYRPERGHWLILLPGEEPTTLPMAESPESAVKGRLKPPIWSVFVEWGDDWVRLWDKRDGRAFWYPIGADGRPAWEGDPERFAPIQHASQQVQIEWMKEWAEGLPPAERDLVLPTVGSTIQGAFRNQLAHLGLLPAWREELRQRMVLFTSAWADANGVARSQLLDNRRPEPRGPAARGEKVASPSVGPTPAKEDASRAVEGDPSEAELRSRLRDAIDRMTVAELLELRLPVHAMLLPK